MHDSTASCAFYFTVDFIKKVDPRASDPLHGLCIYFNLIKVEVIKILWIGHKVLRTNFAFLIENHNTYIPVDQ